MLHAGLDKARSYRYTVQKGWCLELFCHLAEPSESWCGLIYGFLCCITTDMAEPTYKDLIDLLNEAEKADNSTAEVLATLFCEAYPHISVSRPARLLETVRRIAGPVKCGKLKGSARTLYLKRTWTPRIRNTAPQRGIFPT